MLIRHIVRCLPIALVALAGCDVAVREAGSGSSGPAVAQASSTKPAAKAVTLQLKTVDELQSLIASKKGKVVVLDAWSTYCEPCMKEFPGLVAMHEKYGDKLACISLCTNYAGLGKPEDEQAEPLKFLQSKGATFDNILSTDADTKVYEKLKFASVPTIFVYGRDGGLLKTFEGEPTYKDVEAFVAPLIAAP